MRENITTQFHVLVIALLLFILQNPSLAQVQPSKYKPILQAGHSSLVSQLRMSPSGRYAASHASDKKVIIWDLNLMKQIASYLQESEPKVIEFDSGEKYLYVYDAYGKLVQWDIATGQAKEILPRKKGDITSCKIWEDNQSIVVVRNDRFSIIELVSGKELASKIVDKDAGYLGGGILSKEKGIIIFSFTTWGHVNDRVIVLDSKSLEIKYDLPYWAHEVVFSEKLNTLVMVNLKKNTLSWVNLESREIQTETCQSCNKIKLSPDQSKVLAYSNSTYNNAKNISLYDVVSRKKIKSFPFDNQYNAQFNFLSDDRLLLSSTKQGMHIVNLSNNKFVKSFYPNILPLADMGFDIESNRLVTHHQDTIYLWDRQLQRISTKLINGVHGFSEAHYGFFPNYRSSDDDSKQKVADKISITQFDQIQAKIGVPQPSYYSKPTLKPSVMKMLKYSHDKKSIFISGRGFRPIGKNMGLYQFIPSSNQVVSYAGHALWPSLAEQSADGKHVYSADEQGQIKIWDRSTQDELVTSYVFSTGGFVTLTPDGYYTASLNAVDQVVFAKGLNAYTFENFDLIFNRPDIIATRLGLASPDFVRVLKKAWLKRLKRYGLTEEALSSQIDLPELTLNREKLTYETSNKIVELPVEVKSKTTLNRYVVSVNGVPINHSQAFEMSGTADTRNLKIELTAGENLIKISCLNTSGFKSLSQSVSFNYNQPKIAPNLYLLSIGVSEFKQKEYNLTYADKDAQDVSNLFETSQLFDKVINLPLLNKDANLQAFEKVKKSLQGAKPEDYMIIFVASHGLLSDELEYFLAMNDVDFESPANGGLLYDNLEQIFSTSAARNRLILLDACHSGEIDKEESTLVSSSASTETNVSSRGFKKIKKKSDFGLQSSFDLMKELFVDLQQSTGATVISSASGTEFAYESEEWKNGVFTYSLLKGLKTRAADINKDGKIRVSELQKYVYDEVTRLTNGKQHPTSRTENFENDFVIW